MSLPEIIRYIRRHRLLAAGDRVAAAVSGGADSVALLRWLLQARNELGIVVSVAHFNHGIRGEESDGDEEFVRGLAAAHDLPFLAESADVPAFAREKKLSLETAARELRYGFLHSLIETGMVNKVATAHTCDDQAESVLMRVIRGTGSRGLAGIYPRHDRGDKIDIVRPLLEIRRTQVEKFLNGLGQPWREDLSNNDARHTRNRVRHELLPLIARHYNPAIVATLAAQAEISRDEEIYWQSEVARLSSAVISQASAQSMQCSVAALASLPAAMQRRMVLAIAARLGIHLDFDHVERVLGLLPPPAVSSAETAKFCELPGGWSARKSALEIHFERAAKVAPSAPSTGYRYLLAVPGEVHVPELRSTFHARWQPGKDTGVASAALPAIDPGELVVRNWAPGDRFQPARTKAPKKLKELLQRHALHREEKHLWPVVSQGDRILWARGFAMPQIACAGGAQVLIIEELLPEAVNPR